MCTYIFMPGRFPSWKEGREVSGHATVSLVLREEKASRELLLATCPSAGSYLSRRERNSTSLTRLGWGQQPGPAGGRDLRLLRRGGWGFLFYGANYISSHLISYLCYQVNPAGSSPLHLHPSRRLIQTNTDILSLPLHFGDKDLH